MTRPWWDGAVVYQVYPRAFADANGDGVGDLPGITAHLDHLAPADGGLGVEAIWLSPVYPHGGVDGGYDVTDHRAVSPEFGTVGDADRLLASAHACGLRVLFDLVAGHTSDRHPWFEESRAARTSTRRDWYLWADPGAGGVPPSNWVSEFGGSSWSVDARSGQAYHHSFYAAQPDLNWRNPAVRGAMADVMRFWLDRGVDGFRVDAVEMLLKDLRLRDNPPARAPRPPWPPDPGGLQRRWNRRQPGVAGVLRLLRRVADAYPDRVLIGEMYAPAERLAAVLGRQRRDGLHTALDHQLAKSEWDAGAFRRALAAAERHLPPPATPAWALSNHDLPRHATRWGPERARLAALILLTLRGTVCLYQGEEIGMTDAPAPDDPQDAFGRDPQRSPFDWNAASQQRTDPSSLLSLYRSLIAARRDPALRHGSLRLLAGLPSGVLAYERSHGSRRFVVLANMGRRNRIIRRPEVRGRVVVATDPRLEDTLASAGIPLAPDEGVLIRLS